LPACRKLQRQSIPQPATAQAGSDAERLTTFQDLSPCGFLEATSGSSFCRSRTTRCCPRNPAPHQSACTRKRRGWLTQGRPRTPT
jgi:hypothetical protein